MAAAFVWFTSRFYQWTSVCLESMPHRQRCDFRVILALSVGNCAIADFGERDQLVLCGFLI